MTTNDPGTAPDEYGPEHEYTPPPATQWPAPVQYHSGTPPYAPGAYGQSYRTDESFEQGHQGYGSQHTQPYSTTGDYGQFTGYGQYTGYGQFGPAGAGHPAPPYGTPARSRNRALLVSLATVIVAAALVLAGVGFANRGSTTTGSGSSLQLPQAQSPIGGGAGLPSPGNGGALPGGGSPTPGGATTGGSTTAATATQKAGIVTIVSVLKYENAESAGTGMILSADGRVLTNNHVVNGATSITVTVETTNKSYRADVVGTAPTKDVAVLQLRDASGLTPAKLAGSSSSVKLGDAVVGVGNAGGTGTLTASTGKVTGLDKSITATDESGADAERLTDLIEVDAPIISGDSGGPLYDGNGQVIGIDTAAAKSTQVDTGSIAYAIRIDNAVGVARQIESGVQTTTIHIGLPAFVGFSLQDQNGAVIVPLPQGVGTGSSTIVPNSPADDAGIEPGSTITSIGGTKITSAAQIKTILAARDPGDRISIRWTDPSGSSRSATVTLTTGPAD